MCFIFSAVTNEHRTTAGRLSRANSRAWPVRRQREDRSPSASLRAPNILRLRWQKNEKKSRRTADGWERFATFTGDFFGDNRAFLCRLFEHNRVRFEKPTETTCRCSRGPEWSDETDTTDGTFENDSTTVVPSTVEKRWTFALTVNFFFPRKVRYNTLTSRRNVRRS